MKNKYSIIILLIVIAFISCNPEGGMKNPKEYGDYITISSDQTPTVSPDGKLIAYYHKSLEYPEPEDYPTGLYVMDIDGYNRRLLLRGWHWCPSWSPDGEWLVFSSGGVLQIINLQADSIRTFEKGINDVPLVFPDWSSDGKLILFSSNYVEGGGGFICTPEFKQVRQIYNHYQISANYLKWIGDNTKLICSVNSHEWHTEEIFIVDTAITDQVRLTFNDKSDRYPAYSPTGEFITWSSSVQIHRMNTDGSSQKRLDYGRFPTWTPDGGYINAINLINCIF